MFVNLVLPLDHKKKIKGIQALLLPWTITTCAQLKKKHSATELCQSNLDSSTSGLRYRSRELFFHFHFYISYNFLHFKTGVSEVVSRHR